MCTIEEPAGERAGIGVGRSRRSGRGLCILRTHQPGDMGWVVARHGVLYTQEQGWDETFEGLVAEIAGEFIMKFDPKKERCWMAEQDGRERRLHLPREEDRHGGQAAAADRRAERRAGLASAAGW